MIRSISILGLACLLHGSNAFANYLDSQGRDWLTPDATRDLGWTDIASVCSAATGACNGVLSLSGGRQVDLTGYTWASRDDVRDLFYDASGLPAGSLDSYSVQLPSSPQYAEQFFQQYGYTFSTGSGWAVMPGFTRTVEYVPDQGAELAYMGFVYGNDVFSSGPLHVPYSYFLSSLVPLNLRDETFAAYVYKAVPEPGPLALLLAGGLAMTLVGRRPRPRAAEA